MLSKKRSATPKGKHSQNHNNSNITKETRQEAYVVRPVTRAGEILAKLDGRELTARELAYELGFSDLNAVKPRLTELKACGLVEVVGKKKDLVTDRNVAVWRKIENEVD